MMITVGERMVLFEDEKECIRRHIRCTYELDKYVVKNMIVSFFFLPFFLH